jgi:hypothetical protein
MQEATRDLGAEDWCLGCGGYGETDAHLIDSCSQPRGLSFGRDQSDRTPMGGRRSRDLLDEPDISASELSHSFGSRPAAWLVSSRSRLDIDDDLNRTVKAIEQTAE